MARRSFVLSVIQSLVLSILLLTVIVVGHAEVRSSSNYQIQSDSINVGGGYSSSGSYQQESTVGEIATGPSDSSSYQLRAGYQQMQEIYLALVPGENVTLTPNLPGISGGTSNGSTSVRVITDNVAGYRLLIAAEGDPAMQSAFDQIEDYDAGAEPDFSFTTGPSEALFGFTPEGPDITAEFRDNGGVCGTGSGDTTEACWAGLATTTTVIAEKNGANQPAGASTTIRFRVGIGSNASVIAGVYTATTTVTALPL